VAAATFRQASTQALWPNGPRAFLFISRRPWIAVSIISLPRWPDASTQAILYFATFTKGVKNGLTAKKTHHSSAQSLKNFINFFSSNSTFRLLWGDIVTSLKLNS
jgi:hypothetical protein